MLAAGEGADSSSGQALETLCRDYWYPLYAFARRGGYKPQQAEDLTQAFFAKVLEKHYLQSADPERGRFRTFLLTMFKRFIGHELERELSQKRGGQIPHFAIDFSDGERRYRQEPEEQWTAEKIFERRWALTLLDRVMKKLRQQFEDKGKSEFFELAAGFLTGSSEQNFGEIAEQLEVSAGSLRVAVHRMRQQYRQFLHAEIANTLEDSADCESEINYLRAAIRGENP